MTFPTSADQGPATRPEEYPGVNGVAHFDEGIFVGYRWYDEHQQKPLFPFGFGLSYTTFRLSDLTLSRKGDVIHIELAVKNEGKRSGIDVVQVYVEEPGAAQEPPSQLKGFAKLTLMPGETKRMSIDIPVKSLASWSDASHDWQLFPGIYKFKVGESSRDLPLGGHLSLQAARF